MISRLAAIQMMVRPQADQVNSLESKAASDSATPLGRDLWTLVISLAVALTLLYPLALVVRDGLSLAGVHEESVGYRYFYTLRILYGDGERPWLPQGQLVGLAHIAIQLLLTALGFPPSELFPRIDLFSYLGVTIALVLTVAAFAWAARALRSVPGKLALAAALVIVSYDQRSDGFYYLTQPDYQLWAGIASMVTVGWLLRLTVRDPQITTRDAVLLGLFGGACLAIKPTYAIFPLAVGLAMLLPAPRTLRTLRLAAGATALALSLVVAITFTYYLGSVGATIDQFRLGGQFASGEIGKSSPFAEWLVVSALRGPFDVATLAVLLPLLLGLSCLLLPRRSLCLSLLPGAVFSVWFLYQRFTSATMVEANQYLLAASTAWITTVLNPWLADWTARRWVHPWLLPVACWLATAWLVTLAVPPVTRYPLRLHDYVLANAGQRALTRFVEETPGQTLFLIASNSDRPLTVDTAIFKGGSDSIGPFAARWGASPLIHTMFPSRNYAVGQDRVDVSPYEKIVFASSVERGGKPAAFQQARDVFGVALEWLDCSFEVEVPSQTIIGCRVLGQGIAERAEISAVYVPEMKDLAGTRVIAPDGNPAQLAAGDAVLVGGWGELLRLGRGNEFVRLRAREDQSIRLANLGMWVPQTGKFGGVGAVFSGGQWRIETLAMQPVNPNSRFETGSSQDPIPGWSISPAEAEYEVTRTQDNEGPFVRIRALKPSSYLAVNGGAPLPELEGVPITVHGQIRAYRTIEQKLTVHRPALADAGLPLADYTTRSGQWNTLSVRLPKVDRPTANDNFSLGLYDVQPGDIFDIRELSLFVGLLP